MLGRLVEGREAKEMLGPEMDTSMRTALREGPHYTPVETQVGQWARVLQGNNTTFSTFRLPTRSSSDGSEAVFVVIENVMRTRIIIVPCETLLQPYYYSNMFQRSNVTEHDD